MGRMSDLDIERRFHNLKDDSYPDRKQQLVWRIEDLLSEMENRGFDGKPEDCQSWIDEERVGEYSAATCLPEQIESKNDLLKALGVAQYMLAHYREKAPVYGAGASRLLCSAECFSSAQGQRAA